jgi:hypothetical protein
MSNLKRYCVALANGSLYVDKTVGVMDAVSSVVKFTDDKVIQSTEYNQKLYIADYAETVVEGTDGVLSSSGTVLDASGVTDWTALGIDTGLHAIYLSNIGGSGTTFGTYAIATVAAGSITLISPGTAVDGTCDYKIFVCPKYYDPTLDNISFWIATTGAIPQNCSIISRYRSRIVLAGDPEAPHLWYMSRVGDPLDWDYSQSDVSRAVAGQDTDSGAIGDKITAIIPFSTDYLVFGCHSSIWMMYGDIANGGSINNVSYTANIFSSTSWCYGPNSEVLFLSKDGLYSLSYSSDDGVVLKLLSESLPEAFKNIESDYYDISMSYDMFNSGLNIFITSKGLATTTHYWLDWQTQSFWPMSLQQDHEPTIVFNRTSYVASEENSILGCRDGYIRQFDRNMTTDDGDTITNYVNIGPIRLGNGYNEGMLAELMGTLGTGSGDVTWDVYVGKTVSEAIDADSFATGVWTEGRNLNSRPRARGDSLFIKLTGEADKTWAVEEMMMTGSAKGRLR